MAASTAQSRHQDDRPFRICDNRPGRTLKQRNMAVDEKAVDLFCAEAHFNPVALLNIADGQREVLLTDTERIDSA